MKNYTLTTNVPTFVYSVRVYGNSVDNGTFELLRMPTGNTVLQLLVSPRGVSTWRAAQGNEIVMLPTAGLQVRTSIEDWFVIANDRVFTPNGVTFIDVQDVYYDTSDEE